MKLRWKTAFSTGCGHVECESGSLPYDICRQSVVLLPWFQHCRPHGTGRPLVQLTHTSHTHIFPAGETHRNWVVIFHYAEAELLCTSMQREVTAHKKLCYTRIWNVSTFSPGFRSPMGTSGSREGAVSSQTVEPLSVTCVVWPRLASWPGQTNQDKHKVRQYTRMLKPFTFITEGLFSSWTLI